MPQRQLNIRSDEAAEKATRLSKQLGKTTTEVVVEALRTYEAETMPVDQFGMTPDQRRRYEAVLEIARDTRKQIKPGAVLDDSWMYDENGLPK